MRATIAATPDSSPRAGVRPRRLPPAALQIARSEGARLIRHPLVLLGLLLAVATPWDLFHELAPVMRRDTVLLTATGALVAIATLLAAHLATTRPERDGTEDLYEASPTEASARTAGLMLACLWPAALSLGYALAGVGQMYSLGGIGHPDPFDVVAIPAVTGLAGVAGVALGRWIPSRIAGALAAIVVLVVHGMLLIPWFDEGPHLARLMLHSDWGMGLPPELLPREPSIHLVYVLAVAAVLGGAALMRHRSRPAGPALLAAGLAAALLSGGWLVQPLPEKQVQELVSLVVDPSDSLVCETELVVSYCVLPRYLPWVPRWHDTIGGVVAAVPQSHRPEQLLVEMTLEDAADGLDLTINLGPEHGALLRAAEPSRGEVPVRVGTSMGGYAGEMETFTLALGVSSLLLDIGGPVVVQLPDSGWDDSEADSRHIRCTTAGQAREVVALYLAASSSEDAERGLRHHLLEQPYGLGSEPSDGTVWEDRLHLQPRFHDTVRDRYESLDTFWSLSGAVLAEQLLDRPADDVLRRLNREWERWMDPGTSREALTREFDLEPLRERDAVRDTTEGAQPCP